MKSFFAVLVLFAACFAVPAWAQQITGQGAAGYTSNEWYDRSTKDSNTKVDRYLACARQGLYYMPDNPQAEGNCAMIDLVGFRIAPDRSTLQFETTTKGVWGEVVTIKGDTGPDGQAELCAGWSTGAWGECRANNTRVRDVTCNGSNCCGPRPESSEPCTYVPPVCTPWAWGNWSSCEAGQTTQTRSATCPFADLSRCCAQPSPNPETQACPQVCDGTWIFQGWGACNNGVQHAEYSCSTSCCNGSAPTDSQTCDDGSSSGGGSGTWVLGECSANPTWTTASWGNCSAGCGGTGTQTRTVSCANQQGQRAYTCSTSSGCADPQPAPQSCTANCNVDTRPLDVQACQGNCGSVPRFCECIPAGTQQRFSHLFGRRSPPVTQWGYDCSRINSGPNGPTAWMLCNHEGELICIANNIRGNGIVYECH